MRIERIICVLIAIIGLFFHSSCSSTFELYCVSTEKNDLIELLKKENFTIHQYSQPEQLLEQVPKNAVVLFLSTGYPHMVQCFSEEMLQVMKEKNLKVYAEFASLAEVPPSPQEINLERIVVADSLNSELLPMDLLSVNKSYYCPAQANHPLLVIAKVAGFNKAVYGLKDTPSSPLLYQPNKNMWVATSMLSNFASARFMPEKKWKDVWEYILGSLYGKDIELKEWPTFIRPAYTKDEVLDASARLKSIEKGMEWFFNGHFLVHSSWKETWLEKYQKDHNTPFGPELPVDAADGDGSLGILEGHLSAIYADGRQAYRYWLRDDVQGETSMAFAIAGELLDQTAYKNIAENLIDYSFREFRDGPRNDPRSEVYGLLGWGIGAKHIYYGDDNARSFLGMTLGAHVLKNSKWNKMLIETILANYRTAGKYGFRKNSLNDDMITQKGWKEIHKEELINPHPHHQAWLWSCYLWLYDKTGFEELLRVTEAAIRKTMEVYPKEWKWTNGIQQERARMILPLAWLYRLEPTDEHEQWLRFMVAELLKNQVECGAIREELGDASQGSYGKTKSNAAYGLHEAPLIFDNGDPVADMLYTTNFAFFGLNEAACALNDTKLKSAVDKMGEFLIRIQACSEKFKNVDGAWFRAFNYENWDYWASNADVGWGAMSTLTGWIQSWILTTQCFLEMNTSYWDYTKDFSFNNEENQVLINMGLK